jgi:Icc protein
VRLVALDTVIPGRTEGEICATREAWLAQALARGDGRPTIILMHHPPFVTGVPAMDPMRCACAPSFAATIVRHPEIERVVAGHYHRPIVVRYAGTIGFVAPSTAHQVALDLRDDEPARLVLEPPGFALHVYTPGVGMASHIVPVGDFGAAREFELAPEYPGRA